MWGIVGLGEEVVDELCADVGEGVSCIVQEDRQGAVPRLLLGLVFCGLGSRRARIGRAFRV